MSELNPWLKLVLAILATWRLTHLFAREDGPFDLLVRFRAALGNGQLGHLLDCFNCLSVWIAAPIAWIAFPQWRDLILAWPAISGAACLVEKLVREPILIQPLTHHEAQPCNVASKEEQS